jgi:hypothetical protein
VRLRARAVHGAIATELAIASAFIALLAYVDDAISAVSLDLAVVVAAVAVDEVTIVTLLTACLLTVAADRLLGAD